jgi:Spy/CpxP family protein refolding chaperone
MPFLVGAVALNLAATPFAVNAQANTSGQQLLAQGQGQRQGKFADLNLTQAQKDQMAAIRKDTRSQIDAILTPDQRDKFKAAMESRQGRRNAIASMNLSEDQKTQLRTIRESAKSKMQAVLTDQQRQQLQQKIQQWRQQRNQNQAPNTPNN